MSLNNSSHILGLNRLKHSVIHLDMTILIYLKKMILKAMSLCVSICTRL